MFLKRFFVQIPKLESKLEKIVHVFFKCQFYIQTLYCKVINIQTRPEIIHLSLKNQFQRFLFLDFFLLKARFSMYRGRSTFEVQKVEHSQYLKKYRLFKKKSRNKSIIKNDFRTFLFLYFFWKKPSFLRYWECSTFWISKVERPLYIKNRAFNQKKSRNKKGRNWFFRIRWMISGQVYVLANLL